MIGGGGVAMTPKSSTGNKKRQTEICTSAVRFPLRRTSVLSGFFFSLQTTLCCSSHLMHQTADFYRHRNDEELCVVPIAHMTKLSRIEGKKQETNN